MEILYSDFIGIKYLFLRENKQQFIRLIQVYDYSIAFSLKIRLCSQKITINYLSPIFCSIYSFISVQFFLLLKNLSAVSIILS